MDVQERRTYGYHVQFRVLFREGSALHPGMNRLNYHFLSGQALIHLAGERRKLAVRIYSPAGDMALAFELEAEGLAESGADEAELRRRIRHRTAREHREPDVAVTELNDAEVRRALDQPVVSSTLDASSAMTARASAAMAFFAWPPLKEPMRKAMPACLSICSAVAALTMALAWPLFMPTPECPPSRPRKLFLKPTLPGGTAHQSAVRL